MMWDQHLHCSFSGDSNTPPEVQIERAINLGLPGICFTDHCDMDYPDEPKSKYDFSLDFPAYYQKLTELKEAYQKKIQIHIGVEMGLQPHLVDRIDEIIGQYDFDFVIGSTHTTHHKDPSRKAFFEGRTEKEAYREYFQSVLENMQAFTNFDVASHLDYVIRYSPNKNRFYSYQKYAGLIDQILLEIIKKDKALELNTGGFDCGLGHPNPHEDILSRFRELGGTKITIGADGHIPEEVGGHFDKARDILLKCGYRYYAVYTQRKPEMLPL